MDKWFKDILPDKDPYHNRGRDQMRKKGVRNSIACGLSLVNLRVVLGLFYFFLGGGGGGGGGINELTLILIWFWFIVLNATFNNISAISWRPVSVVEEAGVPECTFFVIYKARREPTPYWWSACMSGPDSDTENYRSLWCQTHDAADKKK